jgi:uncharacterized membrane protein SpoIIM required for sporulation
MNEAPPKSLEEEGRKWAEYSTLLDAVERSKATDVERLPGLFRGVCQDLALAQYRMQGMRAVEALNQLVIRGYKHLYRPRSVGASGIVGFLSVGFPNRVRREWRLFWFCSLIFWLPFFGMMAAVQSDVAWAQAILGDAGMLGLEEMYGGDTARQTEHLRREYGSNFMMFGFYIKNNVGIDFRIFGGGILAGVGTMFFLIYNGLAIGASAGYVQMAGNPTSFWSFVAGHSSFELLGMVVAGMAGMRLGLGVLKPGRLPRGKALALAAKEALPLICGAAVMTVLAAFVEGFWSAQPVPVNLKYAVGGVFWIAWTGYFLFMGRGYYAP